MGIASEPFRPSMGHEEGLGRPKGAGRARRESRQGHGKAPWNLPAPREVADNHLMRIRLLPAFVVLLLALPTARAEDVYRWVDADGVHYTNDPSAIPAKSRAAAKVTRGVAVGEVSGDKPADAAAPRPTPKAEPERDAEREKQWRQAFRQARERIESLERQIESDRRTVADPAAAGLPVHRTVYGGILPSPEYEAVKARLQQSEQGLERAREQLRDLERRAADEAVPLEWRR